MAEHASTGIALGGPALLDVVHRRRGFVAESTDELGENCSSPLRFTELPQLACDRPLGDHAHNTGTWGVGRRVDGVRCGRPWRRRLTGITRRYARTDRRRRC